MDTAIESIDSKEPQVKQWRDVVIEHKAYSLAWSKGVTGRWVDFPQSEGQSTFGLEVVIPIKFDEVSKIYTELVKKFAKENGIQVSDERLQQGVEEKKDETWYHDNDIPLPSNIKRVRIISFSQQETLPRRQRVIESERSILNDEHPLLPLTRQLSNRVQSTLDEPTQDSIDKERLDMLKELLHDTFASQAKIAQFEQDIQAEGVEEILIIQAHGGYDNIIGEQTSEVKPLITHIEGVEVNLSDKQTKGNRISLEEIISKYDNYQKNGAILINTCYFGKDDLSNRNYNTTIYRLAGKSGIVNHPFSLFLTRNFTLVSK